MQKTYYAKSILSNGRQPTVKEHLTEVAALAGQYGAELSMADAAELAGWLHDFGKYSERFQRLLRRETEGVNHAACGAALLAKMGRGKSGFIPIVEAIRGHHDGLVSCESAEELERSYEYNGRLEIDGRQAALAGKAEYHDAYEQLLRDIPNFRLSRGQMLPSSTNGDLFAASISDMQTTRMLFSCLVDADYSVSAEDENEAYLEQSEQGDISPAEALCALDRHLADIQSNSGADAALNRLRDAVFAACGAAGELEHGVFNLTAPTGVGKTLALLHFALRHCDAWGKKRVIVVLPFLSLTEQSAKTYRDILPQLLEDTSQSELSDEERLYASRWRVPFLVTTSVKFFETLFSDRPTDCRRLHNIANSVIVFDEAQTLPPELIRATLRATDELCGRYGCTMVFSTATQPDYTALKAFSKRRPREILPDYAAYYARLKRTAVDWRLDEAISWEALAEELSEQRSVCAIVNLRKHARELYRLLRGKCGEEGVFFLTTDLCPAHRSEVIERIRSRLDEHLPCRVVSTQCIEAGVDLDFDAVYRALAPLDSIIQAAGRCNRNGRLPQGGKVTVFLPEDARYPGDWYQNCAETVRRLCAARPIDIHDPEQIARYYRAVYSEDSCKDRRTLVEAIKNKDYEKTAKAYQIIEKKQTVQVIVRFNGQAKLYDEISAEARQGGMTPKLAKRAAPITVSCFEGKGLDSFVENIPYAGKRKEDRQSPFYLLCPQYLDCYQDDMGLQLPESEDVKLII